VLKQKDKNQENEIPVKENMVRGRRYKTLFSETFAQLERLVCSDKAPLKCARALFTNNRLFYKHSSLFPKDLYYKTFYGGNFCRILIS
jgi:hypothetical protein